VLDQYRQLNNIIAGVQGGGNKKIGWCNRPFLSVSLDSVHGYRSRSAPGCAPRVKSIRPAKSHLLELLFTILGSSGILIHWARIGRLLFFTGRHLPTFIIFLLGVNGHFFPLVVCAHHALYTIWPDTFFRFKYRPSFSQFLDACIFYSVCK
jgi:hypothetical protein